jgi:hypothetical protein
MSWVELEPEVRDRYLALDERDQARVQFDVDRLADAGPLLDEPFSKQVHGKLQSCASTSAVGRRGSATGSRRATDHLAHGVREEPAP